MAVGVVLASEGYPAEPIIDREITGVEKALHKDARLFIAGAREENGSLKSNGGRVLTCTGLGSDLTEARDHAYLALSKISLQEATTEKILLLMRRLLRRESKWTTIKACMRKYHQRWLQDMPLVP